MRLLETTLIRVGNEEYDTLKRRTQAQLTGSLKGLEPEEAAVLALLQERLAREVADQRQIA